MLEQRGNAERRVAGLRVRRRSSPFSDIARENPVANRRCGCFRGVRLKRLTDTRSSFRMSSMSISRTACPWWMWLMR